MNLIHSFLKLSFEDRLILIKTLFLLWVVRIMLWILPFSVIQRIMKRFIINPDENNETHNVPIEKLTWAVMVMSSFTLRSTCLTRALTAQILLAGQNYPSNVKIGISKGEEDFEAHAWLESNDKIVLGASETEYTPILNMGENTR